MNYYSLFLYRKKNLFNVDFEDKNNNEKIMNKYKEHVSNISENYIPELKKIIIPKKVIIAEDVNREIVINRLNELFNFVNKKEATGELPYFKMPDFHRNNVIFDEFGNIFIGNKAITLQMDDNKHKEFEKIMQVAQICLKLLQINKHMTKRELFYGNVKVFKTQRHSDRSLGNLASILNIRRKNLQIMAKPRGNCIGNLKIRYRQEIFDFSRYTSIGAFYNIYDIKEIEIVESTAKYILILEKDAIMMRIIEERFTTTFPCIAITSDGSPNYATREFIKLLMEKLKIPAFGLFDCDPAGIECGLTYTYGSISSAMETPWLVVNDIWWLGMYPSDLDEFCIPNYARLPIEDDEKKKLNQLLQDQRILLNPALKQQLEIMKENQVKAEIQVLSCHGIEFLTKTYIPDKLLKKNLIKF